jgi:crotonobetainyl-CoA:carnitine CoA-transferase CaiB-like acyl-CoA transferase
MDAVPALGEHTRPVLGELGYSAAEIDRLGAEGVV